MLLAVDTMVVEDLYVLMSEVTEDDVEEKVEKVEEYTAEEIVEESAAHMKMELISQMLPVTSKIKSGTPYQMI